MPKTRKTRKKAQTRLRITGWLSTDEDEVQRRRMRGATESFQIEPQDRIDDFFGLYAVQSQTGRAYGVEIRSLDEPINSCDCPDHRVNGLGTCKHVEATLLKLQYRRKRAFRAAAISGSPLTEIFLDRRDQQVRIRWPGSAAKSSKGRALLDRYFSTDDTLAGDPLNALPALQRAIDAAHPATRRKIRLSRELSHWLGLLDGREQRVRARQHFEAEVAAGKAHLDFLKYPLYPYQQEGMLHLAFTGRALLADEMGLGKTVQAVAACELLRRRLGIKTVLVVSPASLKGEWEEQIAKFTDLSSQIIQGPRPQRLRQYRQSIFFHLANYEQIRPDVAVINEQLRPDVIILDEAQRIKNWQTKTANAVKLLKSPHAFMLTGTPVENRIDEIYSIVQFLDPDIFGPLFRFNRDFYQLDDKGRAVGYKNLDQLHERLRPIMLRRRKGEVEGQLPGRTVNTYFVAMHVEQRLRYEEYEAKMARLASAARSRPLSKEEMDRLQQYLACMRMLCDTPYILDQDCRISPKLKELGNILQELMEDGDHKIIIFSEWQRMLDLVREQAGEMGLDYAWHTGSVPQPKRRAEIRRFRDDANCRLFLSTDSGAVGLNLQVADVVINLDLPWNPARLEQRIARAWRKHQKRSVQVINLVTEDSIEQRMLSLLAQKRHLAEGVVDGQGSREMDLPSGRAAFLERIGALMGEKDTATKPSRPRDPFERLRDDIRADRGHPVERMELHGEDDQQTLLVISEQPDAELQERLDKRLREHFPKQAPRLKLLDRDTFQAIQELIEAGVLNAGPAPARSLLITPVGEQPDPERLKRTEQARERLAQAEHKRRMAKLLSDGGFVMEALAPMHDAVETAIAALLHAQGQDTQAPSAQELIESVLVNSSLLPAETLPLISHLREDAPPTQPEQVQAWLAQGDELLTRASSVLGQAARG